MDTPITEQKTDNMDAELRANILVEALPYIQEYYGQTVVVKYGGNAMINDDLKKAVMGDVALLSLIGVRVVLVHGGGPELTETMTRMNLPTRFVNGLRVTDRETAQVALMVLAGKINKNLVNLLHGEGGRAIGLSGIDGHMIRARMLDESLGYVGEITAVNPDPILDVLDKGYIPVVSTVGCDDEGGIYNINADTAAARIAAALGAESLITMTDISGILRDCADENSLIRTVRVSEIPALYKDGVITGGMIPKVECCAEAVRRGVPKVFIIDGRVPHSIIVEMLTDEGLGTMFIK